MKVETSYTIIWFQTECLCIPKRIVINPELTMYETTFNSVNPNTIVIFQSVHLTGRDKSYPRKVKSMCVEVMS